MLAEARTVHCTPSRLRIRIESRRGDAAFFEAAAQQLAKAFTDLTIEANPSTGSLLLTAGSLDAAAVRNAARAEGLFQLDPPKDNASQLGVRVAKSVDNLNTAVRQVSTGSLDLPSLLFLLCLGAGAYQIWRGNFRPPPWYTAFWYAFGVFTKSMLDRSGGTPPPPAG